MHSLVSNSKNSTSSGSDSVSYATISGTVALPQGAYPPQIVKKLNAALKNISKEASSEDAADAGAGTRAVDFGSEVSPDLGILKSAISTTPSDLTNLSAYKYYACATNADTGEKIEATPDTFTVHEGNVIFSISVPYGKWLVEASIKNSDETLIYKSSQVETTLSEINAVFRADLVLKSVQTSGGKGKLNPFMTVPTTVNKVTMQLLDGDSTKWTASGLKTEETRLYKSGTTVKIGKSTDGSAVELASGSYRIKLNFYGSTSVGSTSETPLLYTMEQIINIYDGLTTSTWYEPVTSSISAIKSDGTFNLSADLIKIASITNFYVDGVNGSDENAGSFYAPAKTLSRVIGSIVAAGDSSKDYTINISGKVLPKANTSTTELPSSLTSKVKSITIQGNSGNSTDILDGNRKGTVLKISTTKPVTIKNLKITGGNGSNGGAISMVSSSKLTLDAGTLIGDISDVYASGSSSSECANYASYGGGIYNDGGTLTLKSGSCVSYNRGSQYGGGIHNKSGSVTIEDGAKVLCNGAGDGGGIYVAAGTLEMKGGRIQTNYAYGTNSGGALYIKEGATFRISGAVYIPYVDTTASNVAKNDVTFYNEKVIVQVAGALTLPEGVPSTESNLTIGFYQTTNAWKVGNEFAKVYGSLSNISPYQDSFAFTNSIYEGIASSDNKSLTMQKPIYVAGQDVHPKCGVAGSDSTGNGSRKKPYASITKADNKISDKYSDHIIYVDGILTGAQSVTSTDASAKSILILGINGLDSDGKPVDGIDGKFTDGNSEPVLKIGGYSETAPITLKNLKITGGNSTKSGAGVFLSTGANLTVSDGVLITGNTTQETGGGVYISKGHIDYDNGAYSKITTFKMNGGTIEGNFAAKGGDAIFYDGSVEKNPNNSSYQPAGSSCTLGGNAYIPASGTSPETYSNIIQLANNAKITVDSNLTKHSSKKINISSTDPAKKRVMVTGSALSSNVSKFMLVHNSGFQIITSSTDQGKMKLKYTPNKLYIKPDAENAFLATSYLDKDITWNPPGIGTTCFNETTSLEGIPFKNLATASAFINYQDTKQDYVITIDGKIENFATQILDAPETAAKSIKITGKTGPSKDIIDRGLAEKTTYNEKGYYSSGGVLKITTAAPVTIEKLKITGGYKSDDYGYSSTAYPGTGNGGGICIGDNCTVKLGDGVHIVGNYAHSYGGGVYVGQNSKLFMYGSALIGSSSTTTTYERTGTENLCNRSDLCGGGIHIANGASCYLGYDSETHEKTLTGGVCHNYNYSGSMYVSDPAVGGISHEGSVLKCASGNISYNKGRGGGGIGIESGNSEIGGVTIQGNVAEYYGGGIYVKGNKNVVIGSSVSSRPTRLIGNTVTDYGGSGGAISYYVSSTGNTDNVITLKGYISIPDGSFKNNDINLYIGSESSFSSILTDGILTTGKIGKISLSKLDNNRPQHNDIGYIDGRTIIKHGDNCSDNQFKTDTAKFDLLPDSTGKKWTILDDGTIAQGIVTETNQIQSAIDKVTNDGDTILFTGSFNMWGSIAARKMNSCPYTMNFNFTKLGGVIYTSNTFKDLSNIQKISIKASDCNCGKKFENLSDLEEIYLYGDVTPTTIPYGFKQLNMVNNCANFKSFHFKNATTIYISSALLNIGQNICSTPINIYIPETVTEIYFQDLFDSDSNFSNVKFIYEGPANKLTNINVKRVSNNGTFKPISTSVDVYYGSKPTDVKNWCPNAGEESGTWG